MCAPFCLKSSLLFTWRIHLVQLCFPRMTSFLVTAPWSFDTVEKVSGKFNCLVSVLSVAFTCQESTWQDSLCHQWFAFSALLSYESYFLNGYRKMVDRAVSRNRTLGFCHKVIPGWCMLAVRFFYMVHSPQVS